MGDLFKKTRRAIYSLMFMGGVGLAVEHGSKYFEEPQPIPQSAPKVELIGPDYCTPGIEADRYKLKREDTTYRLSMIYDLEIEVIEKYNSGIKDIESILAGGTFCFPPGTLEEKL
ncbi:hypothetical protein HOA91_00300 [Candidatus Woesearchaeota archaeon]|jgi:hypothetical protein|nr:hypothetical protein [Candidatus Woesearchaeota archaeon]